MTAVKMSWLTNQFYSYIALTLILQFKLGFSTEISLDLDQISQISNRYSGLIVDYGEYFELTIEFHFDRVAQKLWELLILLFEDDIFHVFYLKLQ